MLNKYLLRNTTTGEEHPFDLQEDARAAVGSLVGENDSWSIWELSGGKIENGQIVALGVGQS